MDRDLRIRMLLEAGDKVTRPLREMAAGGRKTAGALKETNDRLRDLERTQAAIGSFRALKTGLRETDRQMVTAQSRVAELARAIDAAGTPSKKLAADFARAKREAAALATEHDRQSAKLQELRAELSSAGVGTTDLVQHQRRLRTEIAATNTELTEQTRRLRTADDRARRFAAGREKFGRVQGAATGFAAGGASGIATGMALGGPLVGAVSGAQAFESVMTDIAQKANLSRVEAAKMGAGLLEAARAANQMPEELQKGVDALAGFGLDPRQAVAMMQPIGRASTAYKADIADLSAAAFAATDNLKVPVAQTAQIIDVMAEAGKRGAFEIKDMAGAFPALTAGYQGLGQTGVPAVADLAAALQIARKGAGDSATAANNIANVIQKIGSPQTIKSFKKFGIDLPAALRKAYAEGKTPLEAIAELTNKAVKGDVGKIGFLFEDAQVQQGLRPLIQNMKEYRAIRAAAANAKGTTDRDFAERMKDSAEQTKKLKVNASALGVTLGATLLPTVNTVVQRINAFATRMSELTKRHPMLAKAAAVGAAAFATLFLVLGGGAIAIAGLIAPFSALAFASGALGIGMLPVIGIALGVVAAVTLLGAAAYLIYANWGAIGSWFSGVWGQVRAAFSSAWTSLSAIAARFSDLGANIVQGIVTGITSRLAILKTAIVSAATSVANWFKERLGIHSPSRVFAGFGGFMMQGLANGIDAGEDAPINRIDRLSKRLTQAMAVGAALPAMASPAMAAPGSASAGRGAAAPSAPAEYHFHITQAPGQSPQDLARAIRAELEAHERRKASDRRASFADRADGADR